MAWRVGVDSGGTFTDICLFDESSGRIAVWKVPSTPADPSLAVAQGFGEAIAQIAARASDVSYFGRGTTVATNALIQHRGAPRFSDKLQAVKFISRVPTEPGADAMIPVSVGGCGCGSPPATPTCGSVSSRQHKCR